MIEGVFKKNWQFLGRAEDKRTKYATVLALWCPVRSPVNLHGLGPVWFCILQAFKYYVDLYGGGLLFYCQPNEIKNPISYDIGFPILFALNLKHQMRLKILSLLR